MRDIADFNGDGAVDPGEAYLAFRIWEELNGVDGDDEAPDGAGEGGTRGIRGDSPGSDR